jgi:rod shape-determining protein MreB
VAVVSVAGLARLRLGSERTLAVDLGTANTVVYQVGRGVVAFEPSVVAVDERTGEVYAVGSDARGMIGRTRAHIRATRPLRHGVIADFEMSSPPRCTRNRSAKCASAIRPRESVSRSPHMTCHSPIRSIGNGPRVDDAWRLRGP